MFTLEYTSSIHKKGVSMIYNATIEVDMIADSSTRYSRPTSTSAGTGAIAMIFLHGFGFAIGMLFMSSSSRSIPQLLTIARSSCFAICVYR